MPAGASLAYMRSRVFARDDGKGQERAVKKGSGNNGLRVRERLRLIGLGAWAMADMAGKRPLRALGPMMSALNFRFLFFKKKEEKSLFLYLCPVKQCMMLLKPLFDRTIALIGLLLEMIAEYVAQRQKEGDTRDAQDIAVEYNDTVIYPDKVRLNCYYYRNYSFVKDIQMIFCTVLGKKMEYAGERI